VDVGDVPPGAFQAAVLSVTEIACPHCGEEHTWSSGQLGLAMQALHQSPDAIRVLVDGGSAGALP
jgi:hypothetical protein